MPTPNDELLREDDGLPNGGTQQQEELVITEKPHVANADGASDEDRRLNGEDDDHHDDLDAAGGTDAEREAIRERRRKEKVDRKKRRDEAINRDKIELDFLRKRNDELERRVSSTETHIQRSQVADVDRQIQALQQEVTMADQVIAKAVAAGNGEDVVKAMRFRDEAIGKANQLAQVKAQTAAPRQQANNGMDDRTLSHAQQFLADNKWYDPQGRDEDSAIILAIDGALAREGFDPTTQDYWDELRDRAERRLPERFRQQQSSQRKDDAPQRNARGGPQIGTGRGDAGNTSGRREVYISPERKAALIEAGVWDDPVLRMKYVRRYASYDKEHNS